MNTEKNILSYVRLHEEKYILSLSSEEALKEGFLTEQYQEVIESLNETNTAIADFKRENPNDSINFFDPQAEENKGLRAPGPYGNLSTDDQNPRGTSFWAPPHFKLLEFNCKGKAALFPLFKCRARSTFGGWITSNDIGNPFGNTVVSLKLYSSNNDVDITFETTDSNGGHCNWRCDFEYTPGEY